MSNALLGWVNGVVNGTLAAGSAESSLPITNLQNPHGAPQLAWQTAAGVLTNDNGAWFTCDQGYTGIIRAFALCRTNLTLTYDDGAGTTGGAQVCWRVWQNPDMQDDSLAYSSGWLPANVAYGFGQHVHVAPSDVIGRYIRCDLFDPDNPDGFINVALSYVGPCWQPEVNISWDSTMGRAAQAVDTVTRGGQTYTTLQWVARKWSVAMQGIKSDEVWGRVQDLDAACRSGINVLFVRDPDDPDICRESVFGQCKPTADLSYPLQSLDARGWAATITERL